METVKRIKKTVKSTDIESVLFLRQERRSKMTEEGLELMLIELGIN